MNACQSINWYVTIHLHALVHQDLYVIYMYIYMHLYIRIYT